MGAYDDLIPKGAGINPYADLIPEKKEETVTSPADGVLPVDVFAARTEETRKRDTPISRTARAKPPLPTREEALAAAERYGMPDEALAAVLRPDAPESVTGDEISVKRAEDYEAAKGYAQSAKILAKLGKPNLSPKPLPVAAATDATAASQAPIQPVQAIPTPVLEPKPLVGAAPADVASVAAKSVAKPEDPKEAKLQERAQTLAEALPSFAKGAVKGATAGLVDPTAGTEGAPGGLGQIAGNIAGGVASGLVPVVGAPAFLMTQFLTDLEERGMDPAKMADPEILALAATSGLFGGLMPVAFGKTALKRALTGAALGGAQNVAEEDIMAAVTDTEPERLKAAILGGAFGAGFGAAFRDNPKVREAVEAKLPEADVKVLDEVIDEALPPRAEEDVAAAVGEAPRVDQPLAAEITPETAPTAEIGAETPLVEQPVAAPEAPVTVAPEVPPEGAAIPAAPESDLPNADEAPTSTRRRNITPEGAKVLEDLDASGVGVPGFITNSLRKIAKENGITVTKETTPNDIIEGLKLRRDGGETFEFSNWRNEVALEVDPATRKDILRNVVGSKSATEQDLSDALDALKVRNGEDGLNGFIPDAGNVANDVMLSPRASDDLKARAKTIYDEIFAPEGTTKQESTEPPRPKGAPADASPTKPFGSTPEGIVRAPEPEERYTSAQKEWTTTQRARMDLDEIPSPARHEWEAALNEAKEKNLDAEAETLAKVIIEAPRALNDVETAGMVIRMEQLVQQHEAGLENLSASKDPVAIAEQSRALKEIEGQFDTISKAVRYSGTEKGRNLAAQKLTINKSYDLVHVLSRAKAAKGKEITPEERTRLTAITKQLKDTEAKLADAESRIRDLRARDAIKERRTSTRLPQEKVKVKIADLTEKTRRLLRAGCLTS